MIQQLRVLEQHFIDLRRSSLIQKTIRDYFKEDIGELVVDNEDDFNSAKTYTNKIVPDFIEKIKLYDEEVPLFASYGIESKIESAFSREVKLKNLVLHW